MKHSYTVSIALFALTTSASAQTTLSAGSVTPVPGDQITFNQSDYMAPGAGGASQTWNFSMLPSNGTNTVSYVTVAQTGLGSTFPNATVAQDEAGDYIFFRGTATAFEEDGFSVGGFTGTCTDRLTYISYPLSYNGTYSDNSTCSVTDGTSTWARTSDISGTADGWGTLQMPWGTVNNVLRVHLVKEMVDNQYTPPSTFDNDTYTWYKPGVHGPVLSIDIVSASVFGFPFGDSSATFATAAAVGIEEAMRHDIGVDVQPNPATDRLEVIFGMGGGTAVTIDLLDLTGKVVRTMARKTMVSGVQREFITLSELPAGAYLLRVTDDSGAMGMKRLVKN
jgi:hypothetical protein